MSGSGGVFGLCTKFKARITFLSKWLVFVVSLSLLLSIIIDYGFDLNAQESATVNFVYNFSWWFFILLYSLEFIFKRRFIDRHSVVMSAVAALLILLSIVGKLFPALYFFGSKLFVCSLLGIFSIVELSRSLVRVIDKKTNPALLLSAAFLVIIVLGTLLLMVPRSTLPNIRLSVVDALFVSTSAVCVTGLSPVDISSTFTLSGQTIILLLIQIGALGIMTITSAFTLFFMGETSLHNQFALRDFVGSDTFSSLISTLLYILGFTFAIEMVGFLLIWLSVHNTLGMSIGEEIFFSLFHSVSAFCNAGFSTLGNNLGNSLILSHHNNFYIIVSILVILGGIGFPILVNVKSMVKYYLQRVFVSGKDPAATKGRLWHLANLNTKMVLYGTAALLLSGTLIIAVFEWNGAFASMRTADKIIHSFFNSVSPRTAGFNSVDLTSFSSVSIVVYTILMWIGGASQSTAGGVKVNTVMVAIANFRSILKGSGSVNLFNREISSYSVKRASAIIFGSLITILLFWIVLIAVEPLIPPYKLVFEVVSAISTVGSSLDLTPELGTSAKLLISLLMFIGRVGLTTVLMSMMHNSRKVAYKYPCDNVIIN